MNAATPFAVGAVEDLGAEEIRLLMQMGLHAAFNRRTAAAMRLFEALARVRPDTGFPLIGQAVALLAAHRIDDAVRRLEFAVSSRPDDRDARALLGLALRLARRQAQGRQVLAPLLSHGEHDPASRLAHELVRAPAP
jgi:predicted Zn-dependent protease